MTSGRLMSATEATQQSKSIPIRSFSTPRRFKQLTHSRAIRARSRGRRFESSTGSRRHLGPKQDRSDRIPISGPVASRRDHVTSFPELVPSLDEHERRRGRGFRPKLRGWPRPMQWQPARKWLHPAAFAYTTSSLPKLTRFRSMGGIPASHSGRNEWERTTLGCLVPRPLPGGEHSVHGGGANV
jgi:hypothetical protein